VKRRWRWRNVPVPEPHVGGLILGTLLQVIVPWRLLPHDWIGHVVGWPLVLGGALFTGWAVVSAAEVDVEHPVGIVTAGPYAQSRNPMYVGWTAFYVGVAFVLNSAWLLVLLPTVLVLIHLVVLREERALNGRFGAEYAAYRGRTRRYV
jgi:protein-S-isoprenylcysteine O-methyltransferase Ste14